MKLKMKITMVLVSDFLLPGVVAHFMVKLAEEWKDFGSWFYRADKPNYLESCGNTIFLSILSSF